ncbi:hypothetical protein [Streptomyces sp. NRRL B-24484]|uniref:hypothetical protein n=1 Tax=Streptomyces sp. NRRL B-24484 TaxID=1463833 RepID=UPI000694079E|nr:hypothetical protein [Streptomyces sp. NRRL B-24484]
MTSRQRRRPAALLIALPLLLAGCASAAASNHGEDARPAAPVTPPPVTATPTLASANDEPLPLDAYLLNPKQAAAVAEAQQALVTRCMKRFGFTYSPPAQADEPRDSDAPTSRVDGRYGHQSAALMAKWGYHPEGGIRVTPDGTGGGGWSTTPEMAAAERGVSDPKQRLGPGGQVVNGQKVPAHGCVGESVKQLTGSVDGRVGDAQTVDDIKFATLKNSQEDARTRAVFAAWSQCMKAGGYDYPDPLAAVGDPRWRQTALPTAHEVQVATADAACRAKYNVVGVWYAVDYAYQEQAIKDNAPAMAAAKAALETQVRAAALATAG